MKKRLQFLIFTIALLFFICPTLCDTIISNVHIKELEVYNYSAENIGGIAGGPESSAVSVSNSVVKTTGSGYYAIAGYDTSLTVNNVYVSQGTQATANSPVSGIVGTATSANLQTETFYTTNLMWDNSIWNFSVLSSKGYPTIK